MQLVDKFQCSGKFIDLALSSTSRVLSPLSSLFSLLYLYCCPSGHMRDWLHCHRLFSSSSFWTPSLFEPCLFPSYPGFHTSDPRRETYCWTFQSNWPPVYQICRCRNLDEDYTSSPSCPSLKLSFCSQTLPIVQLQLSFPLMLGGGEYARKEVSVSIFWNAASTLTLKGFRILFVR